MLPLSHAAPSLEKCLWRWTKKMKQYFIFDFLIRKISRVLRCKPGTAYKEASILPMYFCAMKPPPPKSHCSKYKILNNLALSFHLQEAKQTTVRLGGGKNGETETKTFFCFSWKARKWFLVVSPSFDVHRGLYYKIMCLHRLWQLIILLKLKRKVNRTRIHWSTDFQGLWAHYNTSSFSCLMITWSLFVLD